MDREWSNGSITLHPFDPHPCVNGLIFKNMEQKKKFDFQANPVRRQLICACQRVPENVITGTVRVISSPSEFMFTFVFLAKM